MIQAIKKGKCRFEPHSEIIPQAIKYVRLENSGAFTVGFTVEFDAPGLPSMYVTQEAFPVSQSRTLDLPNNTDVSSVEIITHVTLGKSSRDRPNRLPACYIIRGTTAFSKT
jgi:hypothetical protein